MTAELVALMESLSACHSLSLEGYRRLLELRCPEGAALLAERAVQVRKQLYEVYVRGLIEISNFCKNDCLYAASAPLSPIITHPFGRSCTTTKSVPARNPPSARTA